MDKEAIISIIPVLEEYAKGNTIQFCKNNDLGNWVDLDGNVSIDEMLSNPTWYRVKPKKKYRPFKDAEDCWSEMQRHQPFGWVRSKNNNDIYCLSAVEDCGIITYLGDWEYDLAENRITFADGEPFGIKEGAV